jgi:hypothetical protein
MRPRGDWRHGLLPLLLLASAQRAVAFHTIFDYQVDRVEVDGGAYGPADGIPDLVDEFDDGVLEPNFALSTGSAHEAGGLLHLTNPGTHIPFGAGIDVSEVASTVVLHDGGGDFTITSAWVGGIRSGDFVNLALVITGGSAASAEFFGAAVFDFDTEVSLQVYRGEGIERTDGDIHHLAPGTADGSFSMRISFHDDTNTATVSFSFDGGQTFQTYFDPIEIFRGRTDAIFVVGADPAQPSPQNCCTDDCTVLVDADGDGVCDGLDNCPDLAVSTEDADGDDIGDACDLCPPADAGITWLASRSRKRFGPENDATRWRQRADLRLPDGAVLDPVASGLRVQFRHPNEAPTVIVVPPGAIDATGAGWSANKKRRRFTYSDGGHGPRAGIRRVVIRQRTGGTVRLVFLTGSLGPLAHTSLDPINLAFPGMPGGCTQHAYAPGTCQSRGGGTGVCRD